MAARDIPTPMCKPHQQKMLNGGGAAWFYVTRRGLEIYVAETPKTQGKHQFRISIRAMEKALEIIRKDKQQ